MEASARKRWLLPALLIGVLYFLIGVGFGTFARWYASIATPETWNRLAFLISGILFLLHLGHEHFRLRHSPRITATHVAIAVAMAAFGLALMANINDLSSPSGYRPRMLVALPAWPLLTGVPAFIVALIVTAGLTLGRKGPSSQ
jgi:hypothetical protein